LWLVIIGVTEEGKKELIAVESGYRESTESWLAVMRSLVARGIRLLLECKKKWRVINSMKEIKNLLEGLEYKDGVVVAKQKHHEVVAS
jgi:transposase-like protein